MKYLKLTGTAIIMGLSLSNLAFGDGEVAPVTQDPGVIQERIPFEQAQQPGQAAQDVAQMALVFAAVGPQLNASPLVAIGGAGTVVALAKDPTHSLYYLVTYGVDLSGTDFVGSDGKIKPALIDPETSELFTDLLTPLRPNRE